MARSLGSFSSLGDFSRHLASREVAIYGAMQHQLEQITDLIADDARNRFGDYQPTVGPHPAWAELAPSTKAERDRLGFTENDPLLRTGSLRASIETEVSGLEGIVGSRDMRMLWHEFGTARMPPRPVLGPAAFENMDNMRMLAGAAVAAGLMDRATAARAFSFAPNAVQTYET